MSFLNSKEDLVRQLVVGRNLTAAQTSDELRRLFPEERGASVASVRRFCSSHNIRRILTPLQRDVAIARCVAELGPSYGRKMLKGALTSRSIQARTSRGLQVARKPPFRQKKKKKKKVRFDRGQPSAAATIPYEALRRKH